ncbi:hypothetical protein ACIODS_12260 [Micromonospora chalcea]|uniref:hypothetical protein n=1 Tax=Micromonospora chalcea TaxID=1874 RepID=UPI0038079E35
MPASKAQRAATAKRRAEAVAMRMSGATYDTIAEALGYASKAAAYVDITRALEANVAEQHRTVELYREEELQSLDVLLAEAWAVLKRDHVTVSHGRIMYDDTGEGEPKPLLDDGPVLSAIDRILKIRERRAKLLGLDAPTKVEAITIDALDAEIAKLSAELDQEPRSSVPVE